MKKLYLLPLFLLIPSIAGFAVNPPKGFTALFNGKDLSGWYGDNPHASRKADDRATSIREQQADFKAHWSVDGDEFVNDGKGPYATTDRDYGDIELMLEYKT
ncbi:MAG: family 16 glycoside hydrolase, partial [Verrucomicrobiia bacterium]